MPRPSGCSSRNPWASGCSGLTKLKCALRFNGETGGQTLAGPAPFDNEEAAPPARTCRPRLWSARKVATPGRGAIAEPSPRRPRRGWPSLPFPLQPRPSRRIFSSRLSASIFFELAVLTFEFLLADAPRQNPSAPIISLPQHADCTISCVSFAFGWVLDPSLMLQINRSSDPEERNHVTLQL